MKQQREVLRKEKETAEKIAARAFAQSYLADLVPSVFGTLSDNGYFFDPVERGESGENFVLTHASRKETVMGGFFSKHGDNCGPTGPTLLIYLFNPSLLLL